MIHLLHAAFVYQAPDGEVEALRDVSLDVEEGEFCSICLLYTSESGAAVLSAAAAVSPAAVRGPGPALASRLLAAPMAWKSPVK